jgi:TatD DNase family protein
MYIFFENIHRPLLEKEGKSFKFQLLKKLDFCTMNLIDTHCHLYSEEFNSDRDAMTERALSSGVSKFYLPALDSEVIADMLALEIKYPGVCMPMMGLHPCYVKENYQTELSIAKEWLDKRPFVAIGEIGLDFYWDKTFVKEQYIAFNMQMQWAVEKSLPIVIHTRNAMDETIEAVKPYAEKGLKGIFHCFSGNADAAIQVVEMGFLLGIGGVITYKNSGLAEALENIGVEHMVLETDAPYLSPIPFRGKRNESAHLQHILARLGEVKNLPITEVAAITTANAQKIFGG